MAFEKKEEVIQYISSYAAAAGVKIDKLRKLLLPLYDEIESADFSYAKAVLDGYFPAIYEVPRRERTAVTKMSAVIYNTLNGRFPYEEKIAYGYAESFSPQVDRFFNHLKNTQNFLKIDPRQLCVLYVAFGILDDIKEKGRAAIYTAMDNRIYRYGTKDSVQDKKALSYTEYPGRYKVLDRYMEEYVREKENSEMTFSPESMFWVCAASAGMDPYSFLEDNPITKKDNEDALFAALSALIECKPDPMYKHLYEHISQKKREEYFESVIRNTEREQLDISKETDGLFLLSLIVKKLCSSFVAEINATILDDLQAERRTERKGNKPQAKTPPGKEKKPVQKKEKAPDPALREIEELRQAVQNLTADLKKTKGEKQSLQSMLTAEKGKNQQLRTKIRTLEKEDTEPKKVPENPCNSTKNTGTGGSVSGKSERKRTDICDCYIKAQTEQKKIIIVGGNQHLMQKLLLRYPGFVWLHNNRRANCDAAVQHADLVLFKTDSMSHTLFSKVKSICTSNSVPFGYIKNLASLDLLEKDIKKCLKEWEEDTKND